MFKLCETSGNIHSWHIWWRCFQSRYSCSGR